MTENENRKVLLDKGIKLVDISKRMSDEFDITEKSAQVMLQHLISNQRWYPVYANWLNKNYGLEIEKPTWLKPVRQRLREQAA